jgi:DNA-binding NarL/FixJ family response regulator
VRQIAGDWAGAAALWDALGCPYEAARARADANGEATLRDALRGFERLGARPAAMMATRCLRDRGVRAIPRGPRSSTKGNPANLTQREAEVLKLLCTGLSNTAIASRLYLSPKTIEHHVTAIFAKLGVASRAEAIARADQLDLS